MRQSNFLIGRGELLTNDILPPKNAGHEKVVYTTRETFARLSPKFVDAAKIIESLPPETCPNGLSVGKLTMHPSYIAKSYFPNAFLREAGLSAIGSRTVTITPEKWGTQKKQPEAAQTTELFVAGKKKAFANLEKLTRTWLGSEKDYAKELKEMGYIEDFSSFKPDEKITSAMTHDVRFIEIGLQLLQDEQEDIKEQFIRFCDDKNIKIQMDLRFDVGNLCFVPAEIESGMQVMQLAEFSFVRVIRPIPSLRQFRPIRSNNVVRTPCALPAIKPLSNDPKVAILDGGLPKNYPHLSAWVKDYIKLDEDAVDVSDFNEHGLGVVSAFLFGSIKGNQIEQPPSLVTCIRILDSKSADDDPFKLYRTLEFIEEVLLSKSYEFVNLSLGPDLVIEDQEVHAWTSVIDHLLSDGDTFMTIAVGNNGNRDRLSGNARIQVPSDCVNGVSVGATDAQGKSWNRASYSAIGPGRSPGVIKPDLMAFGGSASQYFHVLANDYSTVVEPQCGTSFAAPLLLRQAVMIRSILGNELSTLAIKALLVHSAEMLEHHDRSEVGWGRVPEDISDVITCADNTARIVYQGELKPGKYLRAAIPLPENALNGKVKIKATFCYASRTDPQDSATYTQAGLTVVFRKDENGTSTPFLQTKMYATEKEARSDHGKWETTLHAEKTFLGSTLVQPVFDIHYNAREGGAPTRNAENIKYALIITIEAPKHANLYNEVLQAYSNILVPIKPIAIDIKL